MRILGVATITALLVVGCRAPTPGLAIHGIVRAGPACGVVSDPPDPSCDDRPVAGAEIVVRDEAGESVARVRSEDDGSFSVTLAAGRYTLEPQPVEGLLGTAPSVEVTVGEAVPTGPVEIIYDTGIR